MTTITANSATTTTTTTPTDAASSTASLAPVALGSGSLQMAFAKLQMELCQQSKSNAMEYMDSIKEAQKEQKIAADWLNQARQLQSDAKAKGKTKTTNMPETMQSYMDRYNLAYDKNDNDRKMNSEEWNVAITSLQSRLDQLSNNTQQKMVFVNDYMGQYNSYLQGANTTIQKSNETLAQISRTQ
jgi:hypothetical protein